ncbi:hypothetical protein OG2516_07762 [Oceanicola granulosus HTCC2516]|uniref:Haem-binding uptake Tiki superfamily ChaN domain-containing protein n=1 Tax=Oceanicola granulosus (strain ATCC BAA-861 / DSM 15982 / KCTC 12143 / HTCC2516) TaxID=314256 RepID=Q2CIA2_OCEGH|nr:ChaN family lipoprotein [Oceanicola granulosus]EAR52356.1 hypothetical protein OG2516_07762 [Oceanicola granulosus HTCC2516]
MLVRALLILLATASAVAAQDVFVLGEIHDNPDHHRVQAGWVAEVAPAALVFEMLTPAQAAAAADVSRDDADALGTALGWAETGWPDFALYHPIFAAAPGAAIHGAALGRDAIRRAMAEGAAAIVDPALLRPLDGPTREALAREQAEAHCDALPEAMLPGMVEAQRARDAAFAAATLRALDETGGPVVLITGTGHARTDRGVPAVIAHVRPEVEVFALGQFEALPGGDVPFDAVSVSPPPEREDPCAAFR